MKYDISKKTAPKVLKQENMNENSAIFTLTGIKNHFPSVGGSKLSNWEFSFKYFSTHFICFPNYFFIFA